jgi:ATP-dependent exoDNAse (exonuclease V) alpha subunit
VSQVNLQHQIHPRPQSLWAWVKHHFDYTQCHTVSGFLQTQEKWLTTGRSILPNAVIIVDQATLLSTKQMHDLIQVTTKTGARLITVGDAKSLLSWQAGAPFWQLLLHLSSCSS